jgi:hypothetical protein
MSDKDPNATSTNAFKRENVLPVEVWYLGLKRYPDANNTTDPTYFLLWDDRKLTFKPPSLELEFFNIIFKGPAEFAMVCSLLSLVW